MFKCGACSYVLIKDTVEKYTQMSDCYWMRDLEISRIVAQYGQKGLLPCFQYEFVQAANILQYKKDNDLNTDEINILMKEGKDFGPPEAMLKMTLEKLDYTLVDRHLYDDAAILQCCADVASGLAFLHRANIIHRDLRRANIMMKNKRAVLIDYSHAYKLNEITSDDKYTLDHNVYAPQVCAPEVYNYRDNARVPYGKPADIWAFGITLFELVTREYIEDTLCMPRERSIRAMYSNNKFTTILTPYINNSLLCELPLYVDLIKGCLNPNVEKRYTVDDILAKIKPLQFKYNLDFYEIVTAKRESNTTVLYEPDINNTLYKYYVTDVSFYPTQEKLAVASRIFAEVKGKGDPTAIAVGLYLDAYYGDRVKYISDVESENEDALIDEIIALYPTVRKYIKWL